MPVLLYAKFPDGPDVIAVLATQVPSAADGGDSPSPVELTPAAAD